MKILPKKANCPHFYFFQSLYKIARYFSSSSLMTMNISNERDSFSGSKQEGGEYAAGKRVLEEENCGNLDEW